MNRKINIQAFTLLETLVTLMLISIIIALSYSLINLMGKQLSLFEKENTQLLEYNLFHATLINDVYKSNDFEVKDNHIHLKYFNDNSIDYVLKDKMITRQKDKALDTFKIDVINYSLRNKTNTKNSKTYIEIKLKLLNDTLTTNYHLKQSNSEAINKIIFNED